MIRQYRNVQMESEYFMFLRLDRRMNRQIAQKTEHSLKQALYGFNPIALRKAKIVCNFGLSECNRVTNEMLQQKINFDKLHNQKYNNLTVCCAIREQK